MKTRHTVIRTDKNGSETDMLVGCLPKGGYESKKTAEVSRDSMQRTADRKEPGEYTFEVREVQGE